MRKVIFLTLIVVLISVTIFMQGRYYVHLPANQLITLKRGYIRVDDGDTIIYKGRHIRFLGVDSPEIRREWYNMEGQEPYATRAKEFVEEKIEGAEIVEARLISEKDTYDRYLGHIFIDGESLSLMLIKNGLAYETVSYYGDNGFIELSAEILEAQKNYKPDFQEPWLWKKENRKK